MLNLSANVSSADISTDMDSCEPLDILLPLKILLIGAYASVGLLSLLGNLAVLLVVLVRSQMRTVTNIFISSVSAADLVITLFSLWATPIAKYQKTWSFGEGMCYVVQAIQGASLMWAPFTLAAIAVDRYLLVSCPYKPQMSPKTSMMIIVGIWSGAFLVLCPMLENVMYIEVSDCHKYCVEFWHPNNELRLAYGICVLTIRSAIPLAVISFCHWRIAAILESHSRKLTAKRSSTEATASADIRRKQRLQKLLLSMVIIFAVSSFPIDIFNVLQDVQLVYQVTIVPETTSDALFFISHWIAITGTLLNPLVYAWWNDAFRSQIKSLFSRRKQSVRTVLLSREPHGHTTAFLDNACTNDIKL